MSYVTITILWDPLEKWYYILYKFRVNIPILEILLSSLMLTNTSVRYNSHLVI